jgi:hypothetical protein
MSSPAKTQRNWLLALFGLPFFCVGAGFLLLSIVPTLHDASRMASWPEAQGALLRAQLISKRSKQSMTYRVEAEYRYNVDGRDYRGSRVAIGSAADNVGDFQQALGKRLEQAYRAGQPVSVWYDPDNPADAVLNRDLRWGLLGFKALFVALFGGIGLALMYFGLRGKKADAAQASGAQPWLQRREWQNGLISSRAKSGLYFIWGFAVFWNLISTPVAFFVPDIWREKGALALLVLLFPCVGLGLLFWAIKTTLEWRRFGATPLTMDPFPGAIGGDVGGEILVNIPYQPFTAFEVTLSCINSYLSGSSKSRSRSEKLIWQDQGYAEAQRTMHGTRLQFRFEVPDGLPESEAYGNNYHLWRLNLHSDMPGVDLNRGFEIPVYRSAEKSRQNIALATQYQPPGRTQASAATLLPLTRIGNRIDIRYPMLRKPLSAFSLLLFGAIFTGSGVLLWQQGAREGFPLYLMSGIFSVVGGLIVLAGLHALFNSLHVRLDGRSLTAVRRILGVPVSRKTVAYPLVQAIEIMRDGSSRSGSGHRINYQVIAKTASGHIVLAEGLDSYSAAEKIVDYFSQLIGIGG